MALINRSQGIVWPQALVISLALVPVLGFAQVVAAAEELPREAALSLTLANKAAAAAQEKCKQDGYRVSVAVVDRAGVVKVAEGHRRQNPHPRRWPADRDRRRGCRGDRGRWRAGHSSGRCLRPGRAGQHRRGAQGAGSGRQIRRLQKYNSQRDQRQDEREGRSPQRPRQRLLQFP